MFIRNNYINNYKPHFKSKQPTFQSKIQRLTNINIGMMPQGFIGHVNLKNVTQNIDTFMPVFKIFDCGNEKYIIKNDCGEIIGQFTAKINKYSSYDKCIYTTNPSNVYIDDLFNYSDPKTPFHNSKLDEYKGVGTRLLQIALKRSNEAQCFGNLRLNAMPESKPFYENIGMIPDPNHPHSGMMILPTEHKELLAKLYGGL